MSRTSLSVAGFALVLLGFAGCGGTERHFGGSGGKGGANQGGTSGDTFGGRGGNAGVDAEAGEGGVGDEGGMGGAAGEAGAADAGAGGMAGEPSVDSNLAITPPSLTAGKTYLAYTGAISASGAVKYTWSLSKGTLPAGLMLQGAQSATVTIAGTATEAGQFPITLSVTDGVTTKSVDVTLVITHTAIFLSDRNVSRVNELFITDIGGDTAAPPVRLNASFPTGGGITSYAWSPDGSKVMYLAIEPANGVSELWVASLAAPGTAQRITPAGAGVGQFAWLAAGNIAAYSMAGGDTYLTDLKMSPPTPGKLVVTGKGSSATLRPSPNGTSVGIQLPGMNANDISYATWASGTASAVPLMTVQGGGPYYSYDGRYSVITSGPSGYWFDHSIAAPMGNSLPSQNGINLAWHPSTQSVFLGTGTGPSYDVSRADFASSGMTKAPLVTGVSCYSSQLSWSPDGKNGLYVCANDVRGISNLPTAMAGSDFSLLPSGFLSKTYTDTPATGFSPDSKWVAVRADRDADMQYDLQLIRWSAPGVAYKPHGTSISAGVTSWAFAQNSQAVAFVGTVSPYANADLYVAKLPASGAPSNAVIASVPASAVVQNDVNWLPGSRVIAYRATDAGATQLFAVSVNADGSPGSVVPVSGAMGTVSSYQLAPIK
ncbi:MAG TPA: putative Ig domain-containing protein [Polyangiaceae bacterium]|nr:putative Ig domain-containing protein [Polyangiaceae bacterium]